MSKSMIEQLASSAIPRRRFVKDVGKAGLGIAAASVVGGLGKATQAFAADQDSLPQHEMEQILQTRGSWLDDDVLSFTQDRPDIGEVEGPMDIPFKVGFEVENDFYFQSLGGGKAIFNGDIAVRPENTQKVIDHILDSGLIFQAFHQHYIDMDPQLWFMHFRGVGDPITLAKKVAFVVEATTTQLPQFSPPPPTPLDASRLEKILHGKAETGSNGVVTVYVPRRNREYLQGIPISPFLNVMTNIEFEPLPDASHTAVAPDFAMVSQEIQKVMLVMRKQGFHIDCLYNQETAEEPQLYFSHQIKVGDAYELAAQVRRGLDQMNSA